MARLVALLSGLSLAVHALGGATAAAAQSEDDWEFAEDPSRALTVAAIRYANGVSMIAQCAGEQLTLALVGTPAGGEGLRSFEASRADGQTTNQTWAVSDDRTLLSSLPARDTRFLRIGGELRLRAASEDRGLTIPLELPSQHANLDRVISACSYALSDDRDRLPPADPKLRFDREPSEGSMGDIPGRSMELSCIVREAVLRECRVDHRLSGQRRTAGNSEARGWNGKRVHAEDAAANEGRVVYIFVPLLQVVAG